MDAGALATNCGFDWKDDADTIVLPQKRHRDAVAVYVTVKNKVAIRQRLRTKGYPNNPLTDDLVIVARKDVPALIEALQIAMASPNVERN